MLACLVMALYFMFFAKAKTPEFTLHIPADVEAIKVMIGDSVIFNSAGDYWVKVLPKEEHIADSR